jgi:hypothetical protein
MNLYFEILIAPYTVIFRLLEVYMRREYKLMFVQNLEIMRKMFQLRIMMIQRMSRPLQIGMITRKLPWLGIARHMT